MHEERGDKRRGGCNTEERAVTEDVLGEKNMFR